MARRRKEPPIKGQGEAVKPRSGIGPPMLWCGFQTTGLAPEKSQVLQFAIVLTRSMRIAASQQWVFPLDPDEIVSDAIYEMHGPKGSGLIERCLEVELYDVEAAICNWLDKLWGGLNPRASFRGPLVGFNPRFQRAFLALHLPEIAKYLGTSDLDINAVSQLQGVPLLDRTHDSMKDLKTAIQLLRGATQ